jgi:hypothetical protein
MTRQFYIDLAHERKEFTKTILVIGGHRAAYTAEMLNREADQYIEASLDAPEFDDVP